jgi:hypothetical protein
MSKWWLSYDICVESMQEMVVAAEKQLRATEGNARDAARHVHHEIHWIFARRLERQHQR